MKIIDFDKKSNVVLLWRQDGTIRYSDGVRKGGVLNARVLL